MTKDKMMEMYSAVLSGAKAKTFVDQIFARFELEIIANWFIIKAKTFVDQIFARFELEIIAI